MTVATGHPMPPKRTYDYVSGGYQKPMYHVGESKLPAGNIKEAMILARAIIFGYGKNVRVRIYDPCRGLYSWLEYRPSIVDGSLHLVCYRPKAKYGHAVSSEGKVIHRGARWTKPKAKDSVGVIYV